MKRILTIAIFGIFFTAINACKQEPKAAPAATQTAAPTAKPKFEVNEVKNNKYPSLQKTNTRTAPVLLNASKHSISKMKAMRKMQADSIIAEQKK